MESKIWKIIFIIGCLVVINASLSIGSDTINIGVIAPFKTPPGESLLNAAKMATEDINARNGIMGKKIELILANDEYKPEKGVMAFNKLVLQDKCEIVIGTASSGVAKAIMDQMARYEKLFISTGAASEALSDLYNSNREKYKYWFRVMHQSLEQSGAILDFIYNVPIKKMGAKRVAIMAENALWTRDMAAAAEKFLKDKGAEIVYSEFFDTETKDFTTILTKIINSKADFIYELSSHVDGVIYVKQWFNLKGPMMAGVNSSSQTDRYWKDCGGMSVSEAVSDTGNFRVAHTPKSIQFYDRYVAKFGEAPGYTSGYTYDAFHIYKAAVEQAKTTDSKVLVPVLEKIDYVGVVGRWVFTDLHNAKYGEGFRVIPMVQWRADGSRVVVWPKSVATGEYLRPPWHK